MKEINNKFLKNYVYNLIQIFFNVVFPMIVFPYASKTLLPTNYGKYDFALSFVSYFAVCANLGIPNYAIHELVKAKLDSYEEMKKVLTEIFLITLFASLIVSITYAVIVLNNNFLKKELKLFLIAGIQAYTAFMTIDYFFIAFENHKRRAIRTAIVKIISLIFMFTFIKKPDDYIKFMLVILLPQVLLKLIDVYSIKKFFHFKDLNYKKHFKPILLLFIFTLTTVIYSNFDVTLIGFSLGTKEVGIYSVGLKMAKMIIPLISALGIVLGPKIIENISKKELDDLNNISRIYYNFLFFISIPTIIFMSYFSKEVVLLVSGPNYTEASLLIKISLILLIFSSLNDFIASRILIPCSKEKNIMISGILGVVTSISLSFILMKVNGIIGVLIAVVISEIMVFSYRYSILKKLYPNQTIISKDPFKYIVVSLTLLGVIHFLRSKEIINNFEGINLIKIIFFIMIFYIVGVIISRDELTKKLLYKVKRKKKYNHKVV